MPLDTYNLAELMPLMMEKKRQEENEIKDTRMRRMLSGGATSYNDPAKDKAREYKLMRDAQRKADLEDEMQDVRNVMGRAGEISMGRVGLPGGAAIAMAQNESAMAEKGMMGGQRVSGGYGGRGSGFLSPDQASAVEDRYQSYSGGGAAQAAQEQAALDQAFSSFAPKSPVDVRMDAQKPMYSDKEIKQSNMQNEAEFKRMSGEDELIATQNELAKLQKKGGKVIKKTEAEIEQAAVNSESIKEIMKNIPNITINNSTSPDDKGEEVPLTDEERLRFEGMVIAAEKDGLNAQEIQHMINKKLLEMKSLSVDRRTMYLGDKYKRERLAGESDTRYNPDNLYKNPDSLYNNFLKEWDKVR